jgi:hypothetical protein
MCFFREKGDTDGSAEFLGCSGQGKNPTLWLVAQAPSQGFLVVSQQPQLELDRVAVGAS